MHWEEEDLYCWRATIEFVLYVVVVVVVVVALVHEIQKGGK